MENLRKKKPLSMELCFTKRPFCQSGTSIGTMVEIGSAPPPPPDLHPPPLSIPKWNAALNGVYQNGTSHIKMEFWHEFNAINNKAHCNTDVLNVFGCDHCVITQHNLTNIRSKNGLVKSL